MPFIVIGIGFNLSNTLIKYAHFEECRKIKDSPIEQNFFYSNFPNLYSFNQNHVIANDNASKIAIFLSSLVHSFLSLGFLVSSSLNSVSNHCEISYFVTTPNCSNTSRIWSREYWRTGSFYSSAYNSIFLISFLIQ